MYSFFLRGIAPRVLRSLRRLSPDELGFFVHGERCSSTLDYAEGRDVVFFAEEAHSIDIDVLADFWL